ncbi:MAG: RNA recognition motif domain-containing protein [Bacteroidales bacterium]|jgi:RNA recognition motif-containing protein
MTIYIGNIPYSMKEADIEQLFADFGTVLSVKIITDKFTHRSKGYGFIEMEDDAEGESAVNNLNGQDVLGRNLKVSRANPRKIDA